MDFKKKMAYMMNSSRNLKTKNEKKRKSISLFIGKFIHYHEYKFKKSKTNKQQKKHSNDKISSMISLVNCHSLLIYQIELCN